MTKYKGIVLCIALLSAIGGRSKCCLIFLYKLFNAIRQRRRMGFQSFGPLHILFIMFCQCLVIPRMSSAIFRIVSDLYSYHLYYCIFYKSIYKFPCSWANVPYRITSIVQYMGIPRIRKSRSAETCHFHKFLHCCKIIAFIAILYEVQVLQNLQGSEFESFGFGNGVGFL